MARSNPGRHLLWAMSAMMLFSSCKKNDNGNFDFPIVDSILGTYGKYPVPYENVYPPATVIGWNYMNYFTYNKDGQVVRRMVKPGVYAYYDTVIYLSNDHIVMEEMTTDPNYQSHLWKRELFLELGMVKWKVYYIPDNGGVRQDTVEYIYDAGGKLARRWDHSEVGLMSELTYDVNRNLEKVTSYFKNNRTGEIYPSKWEETFTGYDKVANPLRGSALWDDFLYRSLSGNNFAGYQYGLNGGVQGSFTWQLQYKANGQIDYSR